MELEFPYIRLRGQSYPIVPVTLSHKDREIRTEALVDSGASLSTFHGDLASALGLTLEAGERIYLQGIGGRALGYIHRVQLKIGVISFPCRIVFSNELITSVNLLGRADFFERFLVSFDERNQRLTLKAVEARQTGS